MHQVTVHVVDQEVDLIPYQKIERKVHQHLKHLLDVNQIESQVIFLAKYNV